MYCKNCGSEMDSGAAICLNCGAAKGTGSKYCSNCGSEVTSGASVCLNCGYAINNVTYDPSEQKSKMAAGLFGILLGGLGIHNFYLGNTGKGVAQIILTLFCFGLGILWGLIEGILILAGSIKTDARGIPLKE